jgi:hypothetical protein
LDALLYIEKRGSVTRGEILARFARDDAASVRGILNDLGESGVVYSSKVYGLYDPCEDGWRAVGGSPNYLSPSGAIESDVRLWFFRLVADPWPWTADRCSVCRVTIHSAPSITTAACTTRRSTPGARWPVPVLRRPALHRGLDGQSSPRLTMRR